MTDRMDKLTHEKDMCPHGYYMGTTCFECRDALIKERQGDAIAIALTALDSIRSKKAKKAAKAIRKALSKLGKV